MEIKNKQKKTRKKMKHKKGRKFEKQIVTQQIEAKPVISLHVNGLNNSPKKTGLSDCILKAKRNHMLLINKCIWKGWKLKTRKDIL